MNRQAWRDFFITVFFLGIAFVIALFSSVAAEQRNTRLATIAAAVSLLLALLGALYIIPRLARNVRLEILRFAIRTTITVEGLLFIVCLAVIGFAAWNTGNNLLYLILSAMMAFLIAANLIARVSLADVSVQLRFPDHIYAGESANVSVTLLNHKRILPCYSVMIEALAEEGGKRADAETEKEDDEAAENQSLDSDQKKANDSNAASRRPRVLHSRVAQSRVAESLAPLLAIGKLAYFVLVPARQSGRKRIERLFDQRGRYPITGFRISTKFPAGFFKKWRRIDATGEIIVYPKPKPLDDFYHALPMLAGQVQSHARGSGDDLYAIRRYQASDHMRNIDWKATAKSMQMMVREHTREDEWRLTIVFDTTAPPAPILRNQEAGSASGKSSRKKSKAKKSKAKKSKVEDESETRSGEMTAAAAAFQEKFERAIVMAASLANHFILERADVELITTNEIHNVGPGSGYDQLYKILRSLATLQPTVDASDEPQAEKKPGRARRKLFGRTESGPHEARDQGNPPAPEKPASKIAWRLLEVPVLGDDRRFKVLITSAAKGTIPAHVWRSAHVVFMDDL
jgi:uncharacterized protein (DUF58 family)